MRLRRQYDFLLLVGTRRDVAVARVIVGQHGIIACPDGSVNCQDGFVNCQPVNCQDGSGNCWRESIFVNYLLYGLGSHRYSILKYYCNSQSCCCDSGNCRVPGGRYCSHGADNYQCHITAFMNATIFLDF